MPHISPSQLNMMFKCGEQYRRRYIEKEIIPPGFALHRGSGVHGAAEINNRQKIETRTDLPITDLRDIAAETFENSIKTHGVMLTKKEEKTGKDKIKGQIKDVTVSLAEVWGKDAAPQIQPVLVEQRLKIGIPKTDYNLFGILDTVDENGLIIDLKTSAKRWSQDQADKSIQFSFYSLTYKAIYKKEPAGIAVDVLIAKKKPEYNRILSSRTNDDYQILLNRINAFINLLEKGVFMPASPNAWWCNERWCGYANDCPYYRKR